MNSFLRLCLVALIGTLGVGGGPARAGTPDFVEEFTSFTGVNSTDPDSPSDTGSLWTVFPGGLPTSTLGFEVDPAGYSGVGIAWDGSETKAIVENQDFAGISANASHQIAFLIQFSAPSGPASLPDVVQALSAVSSDAVFAAVSISQYTVGVGHLPFSVTGIVLLMPNDLTGGMLPTVIPAAPDVWHRVVIQYDPASTLLSFDAAIRVWVDPLTDSDPPSFSIAAGDGLIGSFFGRGSLARLAIGNSMPLVFPRPASTTRAGSSRVKEDSVAMWENNTGPREGPGSLADALAFFASLTSASVENWPLYN